MSSATVLDDDDAFGAPLRRLHAANAALAARYPGEPAARQPVHTVYGGAHLFRRDTARRLGVLALAALDTYAPDAPALAAATGMPAALADAVHERVREKLRREPVEDFRIDFEDGYGVRADDEEDGHARSAAAEVAHGIEDGTLPPFVGLRIKPLTPELHTRALRTLELFLTALLDATAGRLPAGFVITLPKLLAPVHAAVLADALDALESRLGLRAGALTFEIMVETPQLVIGDDGATPLPRVIEAARGRAVAAHFGTYDYTASLGITARHQRMRHPACDFARQVMQVALAGTAVRLSDGSTNVLPVPPHRAAAGATLGAGQQRENAAAVYAAWRLHYEDVQDSLRRGFYQGWDLHPAQLVTRYAAVYSFFLEGMEPAGERLRNFIEQAARATLVGDVFDDAATGQGLLNYFLRAINAGAATEAEVRARTGLTPDELHARSFVAILPDRRDRSPTIDSGS